MDILCKFLKQVSPNKQVGWGKKLKVLSEWLPNKQVHSSSIFIFFPHPTCTFSTLLVYLAPRVGRDAVIGESGQHLDYSRFSKSEFLLNKLYFQSPRVPSVHVSIRPWYYNLSEGIQMISYCRFYLFFLFVLNCKIIKSNAISKKKDILF